MRRPGWFRRAARIAFHFDTYPSLTANVWPLDDTNRTYQFRILP